MSHSHSASGQERDTAHWLPAALTAACAAFGIAAWLAGRYGLHAIEAALYVPSFLAGSWGPLLSALGPLRERKLDINFLMLLAAYGAAALNEPAEGAVLLFLFSLSGALEQYTLERTARSIDALIQLRPEQVTLVQPDGAEVLADVAGVKPGDRVRVFPGERIGVDGVVSEGTGAVDESTLTGESLPVDKSPGGKVFAGTLNLNGNLLVAVTHASSDSMLAKIVNLVHQAQDEKVVTQARFERWQNGYVLGVLLLASAATVAHYFGLGSRHAAGDFGASAYAGMLFLVAASPCAVILSIPAAVLSGLTRAARQGVLFKGGAHLERLAGVRAFAFDKTGTLTIGEPEVVEILELSGTEAGQLELLRSAAAVERLSEHPLAGAVVRAAAAAGLEADAAGQFHSHTGQGVHATVNGSPGSGWVGIGNRELFLTHEMDVPEAVFSLANRQRGQGLTSLLVVGCNHSGVIGLADRIRPEAAKALAGLRRAGIGHLAVLTGDHELVGEAVAKAVGADYVRAGLLPDQKVKAVQELQAKLGPLAFVGDGVNDGPALAVASVGIAMGGRGTDVALETADVVLMRDDLRSLQFALWLARRTQAAITRGLVIAFGVIGLLLFASAFLAWPLWLTVLFHEGSTVVTIFSGMLLLIEPYRPPAEPMAA